MSSLSLLSCMLQFCVTYAFLVILFLLNRYVSFWVTTFAILLSIASAAAAFFLSKYSNIFLWIRRIAVYPLLGPWMKILDKCYFQKLERMTEAQKKEREKERERIRRSHFSKKNIASQEEREEFLKSTAMKTHMFGEHILAVPDLLTPERFATWPRYDSSAKPDRSDPSQSFKNAKEKKVLIGQRLVHLLGLRVIAVLINFMELISFFLTTEYRVPSYLKTLMII